MPDYDPTDLDQRDRDQDDAETRERLVQDRADKDLRWLMSSRQGRRIAYRLLDRAGVNRPTFNPNALQMAFAEGFRSYGTWMLARILEVCPDTYPLLLKEQDDERNTSGNGPKSK